MIASRRGIAALALLGALILCAAAAQSAMAVPGWESSKNTTAFTCVPEGGAEDFSDPHCDHGVAEGTGEYGHVKIEGKTEEITAEGIGKSTLIGHPAGIEVKVTSTASHGEGWIENSEPETGVHRITGEVKVQYTGLSLDGLSGCTVKEPVVLTAALESVENQGAMGIEFRQTQIEGVPQPLAHITIEGCILAGTYPLWGSMVATGTGEGKSSGATLKFNPGVAHESLEFFGKKTPETTFESETTVEMKNGNPISAATVT